MMSVSTDPRFAYGEQLSQFRRNPALSPGAKFCGDLICATPPRVVVTVQHAGSATSSPHQPVGFNRPPSVLQSTVLGGRPHYHLAPLNTIEYNNVPRDVNLDPKTFITRCMFYTRGGIYNAPGD